MSFFGFGGPTTQGPNGMSGTNQTGQQLGQQPMNPNGQPGQPMNPNGQSGQQANNSGKNNLTKMLYYLNYKKNNQKNVSQLKPGLVPVTQELLPAQLEILQKYNMEIPPQIYTTSEKLGTNLIYMGKIWNKPGQPGQQMNPTGQQPAQQPVQQPGQQMNQTGQQPAQGWLWGGSPEINQPANSVNNKKEDLFYPNETNIQINNTKNLETIKNEGVNSTNKNLVFMRENGAFVLNQLSFWSQNYSCTPQMNQTTNNRNGKPKYLILNDIIWYYIFECPDAPANSGQTAQKSTGFWGGKNKKPTKKPVKKIPTKKPVEKTQIKKPVKKIPTKKPVKKIPTKKPFKKTPTKKPVKKPTKKPVKKTLTKKSTIKKVNKTLNKK
jgi:hypothetical protein